MTDEKLITEFLEKNYTVKTSKSSFVITEVDSYKEISPRDFVLVYRKIFGEFVSPDIDGTVNSIEYFQRWFNAKKRILTHVLTDYLEKASGSDGSMIMLNETLNHFTSARKQLYHEEFITNFFNDFYKEKYIIPTLNELISLYKEGDSSKSLIESLQSRIDYETDYQQKFATNWLNEWYSNTVIGDKLNDFFSQLIVTLGSKNWVVTWIGHGPLSQTKMLSNFAGESDFHTKYILSSYDKWYEEAVIEASERLVKKGWG
jgi:hypothetical protein